MVTLTHTREYAGRQRGQQEGRDSTIAINYDNERHYLAAIGCLRDMYARQLIDESDYSALECRYAEKYTPLIRYKKPCDDAPSPVTLPEGRHECHPEGSE